MFVLPDLTEQFEAVTRHKMQRERVTLPRIEPLRVAILCLATAFFVAAAGLWVFPADDYAMVLVKLGASLGMIVIGAVLMSLTSTRREPGCVQLDVKKRQIRTYEQEPSGRAYLTGRYDLDAMAEISLRNRTLFARNSDGRFAVSVPVRSRAKERAIRDALALA